MTKQEGYYLRTFETIVTFGSPKKKMSEIVQVQKTRSGWAMTNGHQLGTETIMKEKDWDTIVRPATPAEIKKFKAGKEQYDSLLARTIKT